MPDERALGEAIEDAETPTVVDVTPPLDPQDFDINAFLDGKRPTRRAVELWPNGHLVGRLEEIAGTIEPLPDGPQVDALIDEFEEVKALAAKREWWHVEARSSEWVGKFRRDAAALIGAPAEEEDWTPEQEAEVNLRQTAAQVVIPSNVTVDTLRVMNVVSEPEVNKLKVAVVFANQQPVSSAKVFDLDFSRRRSGNRRQRRSSTR